MKIRNRLWSIAGRTTAIVILGILVSASSLAGAERLQPEVIHSKVSRAIGRVLMQYHYNHYALNDSMSSEIFDRYIKNLDYNRVYFLASDIKRFDMYRHRLDDFIKTGQLRAVYEIFNVFSTRVEERLAFVEHRLNQEDPFDFTRDEFYELDREKAPWPKTSAEADELWRKRLKNDVLNLKLAGKEWDGVVETLQKRYNNFHRRLSQYNSEDVFQLFMNAVAQSYDPHTNYFSPISSDNFRIRISQSFEGIGARLTSEDEFTKIFEIIPGGPADLSKQLHPNDRIIGVGQGDDGEMLDVIGWRLDDVVQRIRGKRGTVVRLQVLPADAEPGDPSIIVRLVRDKIKLEEQSAKSKVIEVPHNGETYRFGVIDIPTFYSDYQARERGERDYKSTTRDVRNLIAELQKQNVDGLIIDLRRNGGGILQEAIELTGLFIRRGPVVQVRNSNGSINIGADPDPGLLYDGPLAVVVDRMSASASEIFAAAIQDYGRGIIIGGQTFGKGTVQHLIRLDRFVRGSGQKLGQLKVTVSKFYRINGGSTQHRGVLPDILMPSRFHTTDFGESTEENALMWDQIRPTRYTPYNDLSKKLPELKQKHRNRIAANIDFRFLQQDIEERKARQRRTQISLNEAVRKAEREKAEKRRRERINARRIAKGLPPLKENEKPPDEDEDIVLSESGHVLADYMRLYNHSLTGTIH